jgi:MFS family permease
MSPGGSEAGWGLLRSSRNFRLYWIARTVSIAGSQLARVALTAFVYQLGGGAAGVSVLLLAMTLPRLFGPLAGTIADRVDNRLLMAGCDGAGAVLFGALAWVRWWPGVIVLVVAATLASTIYLPAGRSSVPALAGKENLARANALLATGMYSGVAIGPAIAGVMLTFGGPAPAMLLNAASFAISALLTLRITGLRGGTPWTGAAAHGGPLTIFGAARAGLAIAWQNRVARIIAIALLPSVGLASLDNAALIFLVRGGWGASSGAYGWVVTAFSIGMSGVPVLLAAQRWALRSRPLFYGGQGVYGAATIVTGLVPSLGYGVAAQVVAGGANGAENVGMDTLVQESTPDAAMGAAFGIVYTSPYAGQILAYLAAAPLIAAFGARTTFVVSGAGLLIVLACMMALLPGHTPLKDDAEGQADAEGAEPGVAAAEPGVTAAEAREAPE